MILNKALAKIKILDYEVDGVITVDHQNLSEAILSYQYDPAQDKNRKGLIVNESQISIAYGYDSDNGIGICIPRDTILSVSGSTVTGSRKLFSLFGLNEVTTSANGLAMKTISQVYRFQYGLIGDSVEYYQKTFDKAEFSFHIHNETAELKNDAKKFDEFPNIHKRGDITEWKIDLSDDIVLSLSIRYSYLNTLGSLSIDRQILFSLESKGKRFSVHELMDKYIEPIRSLLSISVGGSESIKSIRMWNATSIRQSYLVSPTFARSTDVSLSRYNLFNPGQLTKEDYRNWLKKYSEVEYMAGLIESSFSQDNLEYILGRILPQIEQLFKLNPGRSRNTTNFAPQIRVLINENMKKLKEFGFIFPGINHKDAAARIKKCRTYWIHGKIETMYPKVAQDELLSILSIVVFIYILEVFKHSGIDKDRLDPGSYRIQEMCYLFLKGYGKWCALDPDTPAISNNNSKARKYRKVFKVANSSKNMSFLKRRIDR